MTGGGAGGVPLRDLLAAASPRVLGAVTRRYGDFAAAEDAVQEALLAAHVEWPRDGPPRNPSGWLYRVACRRMADHLDGETARRRREEAVATARPAAEEPALPDDEAEAVGRDETLLLLFLCCHPALAPPAAIALTLRALCGLTTKEIAGAFLVPEATMAQRITRAKRTIAESAVPFALPAADERPRRLELVLHVLYLMFNEGYASTSDPRLVRVELSDEAIRLMRILHRLEPEHAEAAGLLALMLLTDARRPARTGPNGELVPLHEQDRRLWDRSAIAEGTALVTAAFKRGAVGSYQLQAAIAALHDDAPSVEKTDWPQILALYGMLQRMSENPMVALNRVIAGAMVHGPATGLRWLDALADDPRLARHHRLAAVRAHLLEMAGDRTAAAAQYRAAAAATASPAERQYLLAKASRL
jgi:RNA polymerase sigma factor (sigma-70 family)